MFQQHQDESLYDAWTRFKDLIQKVPHHGLHLWLQVQIFYDHVDYTTQMTIDYEVGGIHRKLRLEEVCKTIKNLAQYKEEEYNDPTFSKKGSPDYIDATLEQELESMECLVESLMRNEVLLEYEDLISAYYCILGSSIYVKSTSFLTLPIPSLGYTMSPRMMIQNVARQAAAPQGRRTGGQTGRGGERTGVPMSRGCSRTGNQGIQGGNHASNIQGDVRSDNMSNGRNGCSYKEFMVCNPKDYDGKGGAIVYTRWIEKIELVHDMSRKENVRDDNKRSRTGKAFAIITNPVRKEYMGTAPKCTSCSFHHNPQMPCRKCTNYNLLGKISRDCRVGSRMVTLARGGALMMGAEEARQDPNIMMDIEPSDLGFSYEIKLANEQLVEINKEWTGCPGTRPKLFAMIREKEEHETNLRLILELPRMRNCIENSLSLNFSCNRIRSMSGVRNRKKHFRFLKDKLCNTPVLALLNGPEDFTVYCNASGVVRFGKKGKLAPRFVGPFEITIRITLVAYRLRLPQELNNVHDTFHVSNLKKCLADQTLHVSLEEIQVDSKLKFMEEPAEILEREFKKLKQESIPIIKV
nr:putative reverse transcriptase domain, ribonuclease H-like domain, aspartic peptidase domain protein [Tanacetum cinerariifolium]